MVYHKIEFINKSTGVSIQAVKSFHNERKFKISKMKGAHTE
ncbi:hypothetical protein H311_00045 [Anncaliia algerae PRA109]|nr:hypothetical protein H311_00045 [Anncaliia algerae PRA109]